MNVRTFNLSTVVLDDVIDQINLYDDSGRANAEVMSLIKDVIEGVMRDWDAPRISTDDVIIKSTTVVVERHMNYVRAKHANDQRFNADEYYREEILDTEYDWFAVAVADSVEDMVIEAVLEMNVMTYDVDSSNTHFNYLNAAQTGLFRVEPETRYWRNL